VEDKEKLTKQELNILINFLSQINVRLADAEAVLALHNKLLRMAK